ncbi:MAG: ribonuclease HI [Gammaproteobacteria bacterium]|nr:ribonuclease HI [Gammaproteobacteria bacterium]MDH3447881.1 ribonuclease HI [Gammaproteobacteria bacterium]
MSTKVVIYTDGACRGNPGPGGWGAVLRYQDRNKTLRGYDPETTNNRMELTAVIEGLRALKRSCHVELYTDSKYVMQGINEWISNWKSNGWKTSARKPVKNVDLWRQLDQEVARHEVDWNWVRGHTGVEGNELADRLANEAIDAQAPA